MPYRSLKAMTLWFSLFVSFVFTVSLLVPIHANAALSDNQLKVLRNVSKQMNSYRTMSGEFLQTGPNGGTAKGVFHLKRPGQIRFKYNEPDTIDIIADGESVAVINKELETQDLLPLKNTPLRYLLRRRLNLAEVDGVKNVGLLGDNIVVIIEDKEAFNESRLRLFFHKESFELQQWIVTDAQGLDTSVQIFNTQKDSEVKNNWFRIKYPGQ
ncbi:MAG: outer-membrane lipoprotein carrier protein LolA [Pseudomonadota bacterium]